MYLLPGIRLFLDVDILENVSDLPRHVNESVLLITFMSRGYFSSQACLIEQRVASEVDKPLALINETDFSLRGKPVAELRAECPEDIRERLFDSGGPVIPWTRHPSLEAISLRLIAETVVRHNSGVSHLSQPIWAEPSNNGGTDGNRGAAGPERSRGRRSVMQVLARPATSANPHALYYPGKKHEQEAFKMPASTSLVLYCSPFNPGAQEVGHALASAIVGCVVTCEPFWNAHSMRKIRTVKTAVGALREFQRVGAMLTHSGQGGASTPEAQGGGSTTTGSGPEAPSRLRGRSLSAKNRFVNRQPTQPIPAPFLENALNIGMRMIHVKRGAGTVVQIDRADPVGEGALGAGNLLCIQFDNGETHKYRPSSWHKLSFMGSASASPPERAEPRRSQQSSPVTTNFASSAFAANRLQNRMGGGATLMGVLQEGAQTLVSAPNRVFQKVVTQRLVVPEAKFVHSDPHTHFGGLHFVLFLNASTFQGPAGAELEKELRKAYAKRIPVTLVHALDEANNACAFDRESHSRSNPLAAVFLYVWVSWDPLTCQDCLSSCHVCTPYARPLRLAGTVRRHDSSRRQSTAEANMRV